MQTGVSLLAVTVTVEVEMLTPPPSNMLFPAAGISVARSKTYESYIKSLSHFTPADMAVG